MRPRAIVKEVVYALAHGSGLNAVARRGRRDGLVVLTYHSFGPAEEHPYLPRMPMGRFMRQLEHLQARYEVVRLEEGVARLLSGAHRASPVPMLAITVDDGYGDNYEHLFPALRAAGVPATIFLATDYLDSLRLPWPTRISALLHHARVNAIASPIPASLGSPAQRHAAGRVLRRHFSRMSAAKREEAFAALEEELRPGAFELLRPLSWDQVREMARAGISFGSHTCWHGWLDLLDEGEVERELGTARRRIEAETGQVCTALAYPNGNWSDAVAQATGRAGYKLALTQQPGVNREGDLEPLALKRIEVPFDERIGTFACRVGGIVI